MTQNVIFVSRDALDRAAIRVSNYDPEQHHPADYALSIVATILGLPQIRRDGETACISLDSFRHENA